MSHIVLAKAWNNGKFLPNGGGYGIRLTNYFKDEYLDINWVSITLELEGWEKQVELAINTDAFWSHGRELRSGVIGRSGMKCVLFLLFMIPIFFFECKGSRRFQSFQSKNREKRR